MLTLRRQRQPGQIRVPQHVFLEMMRELERRSQHRREAGAFLLGPAGRSDVTTVAYYDDLDPDCLTGGITFHAAGYTRLNQVCRELKVRVLADIHLHPGVGVRQSATDAAHPMVAKAGHLALIAPRYGRRVTRSAELGVHLKTSTGWSTYTGSAVKDVLTVNQTLRGRTLLIGAALRRRTSRI